ncbi:MAG: DNA-methyltransferase [Candidatus Hodarchaeales archaeon]
MNYIEMEFLNNYIIGDASQILKKIPSESIQLVITSPPYFQQRDYGGFQEELGRENNLQDYINKLMRVFTECVRVVKKDGSIVFNVGDKFIKGNLMLIPYRFAIEAQKFNVRLNNNITWVKTNPTPKQYKKRLISSTEPFFHFVKSKDFYYNLDDFYNYKYDKFISKNRSNTIIGESYFSKIDKSNLSPEQKQLARKELEDAIREVKEGKIAGIRMKIKGVHAPAYGGQAGGRQIQMEKKGFTIIKMRGRSMKKDIIEESVETLKGAKHPAIYPEKIIDEFIKLLTQEGDTVLDPFAGSGTTLVSAHKLKRNFIGVDINPEYRKLALERLAKKKNEIINDNSQAKLDHWLK